MITLKRDWLTYAKVTIGEGSTVKVSPEVEAELREKGYVEEKPARRKRKAAE